MTTKSKNGHNQLLLRVGALASILTLVVILCYASWVFRADIPYSPWCHLESNVSTLYMHGLLGRIDWTDIKPDVMCENGVEIMDQSTIKTMLFSGYNQSCYVKRYTKVCE